MTDIIKQAFVQKQCPDTVREKVLQRIHKKPHKIGLRLVLKYTVSVMSVMALFVGIRRYNNQKAINQEVDMYAGLLENTLHEVQIETLKDKHVDQEIDSAIEDIDKFIAYLDDDSQRNL